MLFWHLIESEENMPFQFGPFRGPTMTGVEPFHQQGSAVGG
jgi:hypothetical protein